MGEQQYGVVCLYPYHQVVSLAAPDPQKPFFNNGRLIPKSLRDRQFIHNGELDFGLERIDDDPALCDRTYRTRFGPCFYHPGVIYANCDRNFSLAMRRLTACRGDPANETVLCDNQRNYIRNNFRFIRILRNRFRAHLKLVQFDENIRELVSQPHPKKKVREQAYRELLDRGIINSRIWKDTVAGKFKKDEIAKNMKYPRLIADLTTLVSLMGAHYVSEIKTAMSIEHISLTADDSCRYIKSPDQEALSDAFNFLINSTRGVKFIYHSDDSSLSVNGQLYNMDISSCDGSHTEMIFTALAQTVEGSIRKNISATIDQLKRDFVVKSVHDKNYKCRFTHDMPILFSGSVLTTLTNNLANYLIFTSIVSSGATTEAEIIQAARNVGYVVTLQKCNTYHELQFLKHSPVSVGGVIKPLINIGVILRALGQCKGDVPGSSKIPLEKRFNAFNKSIFQCFQHGEHAFITCGLQKYKDCSLIAEYKEFYNTTVNPKHFLVDADEVTKRYGLPGDALYELCDLYQWSGIGSQIRCRLSTAALVMDYSLGNARVEPGA